MTPPSAAVTVVGFGWQVSYMLYNVLEIDVLCCAQDETTQALGVYIACTSVATAREGK